MPDDTPISEMVALDPDRVDLVTKGANGFPALVMKAAEDEVSLVEVEKAVETFCGDETCEVCKEAFGALAPEHAEKAQLKAKQRNALPDSTFAIPEDRAYPIHDKSHARNALARASGKSVEARVRAAVHKKWPTIDEDDDHAEKSVALPNGGVPDVHDNGHAGSSERADDSPRHHTMDQSGTGTAQTARCPTCKGVGYLDSEKPGAACPTCLGKAFVVSDAPLTTTAPRPVSVAKDGSLGVMATPGARGTAADAVPGSPVWESYDAVSLADVAGVLTSCETAIEQMALREHVEALSGVGSDWADTMDLECAQDAVQHALGIVARLAFHEQAETAEKGALLRQFARTTLSRLLGGEPPYQERVSKEDTIVTELTTDQLTELVAKSSAAAATAAVEAYDQRRKAEKKEKAKAAKAEGNSTTPEPSRDDRVPRAEPDSDVESELESHDVTGGPGVQQAAGGGAHTTSDTQGESMTALKAQLEQQNQELSLLRGAVERFGKRPRSGGPLLDGVPRGSFVPVVTQNGSTPDGEIVRLEKALDETHDPNQRTVISQRLTHARLVQAHRTGKA